MNEAKNYTIEILGDQYTIVSDEVDEHITQTAAYLNALLHDVLSQDASIDHKKAVVLTALRITSDLIHLEREVHMVQSKGQQLVRTLDKHLCSA
jgi:cell division protein ZapA (FtsZ GTPase activity inhibitor)